MKKYTLLLGLCLYSISIYCQKDIGFQASAGPNFTIPKVSYDNSGYSEKILDGSGKIGYNLELMANKKFNAIKLGIRLINSLNRIGFKSDRLIFPEDAVNGTHSSIETSISSIDLGLGALMQLFFNQESLYAQFGIDYMSEITSSGNQKITFGYDPNISINNDDVNDIYSYEPGAVINLGFGNQPIDHKISYKAGLSYYLAKQVYKSFGWEINKISFNINIAIEL